MSKGLKRMVEDAMNADLAPVQISDEARRALSYKVREFTGDPRATLTIGVPQVSPFAQWDSEKHIVTANVDALILNPNRVLLTVTPFRLKQEAVLTGCLLHEGGHARHSRWRPRNPEEAAAHPLVHGPESPHRGEPVTDATIRLAMLVEEARIEGLMARNADNVGASGLDWTLRAASARLTPTTNLSADPDQQVMDIITSWVLRAGKRLAQLHWLGSGYGVPRWISDFTHLLDTVLAAHLEGIGADNPTAQAYDVKDRLIMMMTCVDDYGTYMVDTARDIIDILFPETNGEPQAQPSGGCSIEMGNGEDEEAEQSAADDESGEQGEGNTEPEDEGSGEDPGAGDSGSEDEAEQDSDEQDGDEQDNDEAGATSSTEQAEPDAATSELAKALAELEDSADDETAEEAEDESEKAAAGGAGTGGEGLPKGMRNPTKEERELQHGAETFLRSMISPTEASQITLTDQPAATVDGAALCAWKAGGQVRDPHFFKRTRRSVEPAPPVKIAVLVDVSGSMDEMQEPSAVLSWALASAAMDLRNFAGRGQQIESCLIHWGSSARVIQKVGQPVEGLQVYECWEGTSALAEAYALVEEQMPGFFDPTPVPVNRLLVNFTDWDLTGATRTAGDYVVKMLASGVNMLSVVPKGYNNRWHTKLPEIMSRCTEQRGMTGVLRYNPNYPAQVWDTAADLLNGKTPSPFAGF